MKSISKLPIIPKLSLRFTLWYSLLVFVAFGSIILMISQRYNLQIINEKSNVIKQKLDLISATIGSPIKEIRTLHDTLLNDKTLVSLMHSERDQTVPEAELIASLSQYSRIYRDRYTSRLKSLFFCSTDAQVLDTLYGTPHYSYLTQQNKEFDAFVASFAHSYMSKPNAFPLESTASTPESSKSTITYYGAFYDKEDFERLGTVIINIKLASLFSPAKKLCDLTFESTYVIDSEGNIIYSTGKTQESAPDFSTAKKTAAAVDNRMEIGNNTYLLYTRALDEYPSWSIVGFVNYQEMTKQTSMVANFVWEIFIIAVLLVALISFQIAKRITVPIHNINAAMRKLEVGDWPDHVASDTHDEIEGLVHGFNRMTDSVRQLTSDIILQQEDKKRIEVAMVKSQLDLLQSQINPHFIHNTLNTLNYMALQANNTELSQTIVSFNALLRASISTQRDFVTVAEEISYVQSYMHIQNKRYEGAVIDFRTYVDDDIRLAQIPRLILQPLVENALYHGIIPSGRPGRITITCLKETEHTFTVMISDDGVGIAADKMNEILSGDLPNPRGYNSIGMINVRERLQLHYGDSCAFKIASQAGFGTIITFTVLIK